MKGREKNWWHDWKQLLLLHSIHVFFRGRDSCNVFFSFFFGSGFFSVVIHPRRVQIVHFVRGLFAKPRRFLSNVNYENIFTAIRAINFTIHQTPAATSLFFVSPNWYEIASQNHQRWKRQVAARFYKLFKFSCGFKNYYNQRNRVPLL